MPPEVTRISVDCVRAESCLKSRVLGGMCRKEALLQLRRVITSTQSFEHIHKITVQCLARHSSVEPEILAIFGKPNKMTSGLVAV
jgi:hypothetical protein